MKYHIYMRTIHRDIAGGFIFSKDGKLLLGKNSKGGVWEGLFTIPGGGVKSGESIEEALQREILEETGINISSAKVSLINKSKGEHKKTLHETGERVLVKMVFHDYQVDLDQNYSEVIIETGAEWGDPQWFGLEELKRAKLAEPVRKALLEDRVIKK